MEMAPIDRAVQIQGDITAQSTADAIIAEFQGKKAQLVVSDGAPDVLGLHDLDEYLQEQLVLAALNISLNILEDGGTFVAKIFRGKEVSRLYAQLLTFFDTVECAKPKASRNSSFESFVVCKNLRLPPNFTTSMELNLFDFKYASEDERIRGHTPVVFRSCGDVDGWDADQSYPVDDYVHQEPLQKPINPPEGCAKKAMDYAAPKGHLDDVQCHEGKDLGHFEIAKFLHESRTEGCTPYVMDAAAAKGYMDIVKHLHKNLNVGFTTNAIYDALFKGHLNVIKFLYEDRNECCTSKDMDNAARNELISCTQNAFKWAAENHSRDVLKYLVYNRTASCSTTIMDFAAEYGYLDVVQYLHGKHSIP
ncbi:ribosomal RNA methyltransferase [Thraustotheca clavata]|uniref:Ribosomal RNA methyltransferase n=1 Tax=Thraustotheca clavata TaxID=74557 RepID=A0A1W0A7V7_9STRA|nr:ribosomal RNA methyltransferase [Thraustotheca clavata]